MADVVLEHLTSIPAREFVKHVGIVEGRNIRLDRNVDVKGLAALIAAASQVYEAIRIAKPTPEEVGKSDIKSPHWVVSSDGHRRVQAVRYLYKTGHASTKGEGLAPVPVIVERLSEEEILSYMLRSGGRRVKESAGTARAGYRLWALSQDRAFGCRRCKALWQARPTCAATHAPARRT